MKKIISAFLIATASISGQVVAEPTSGELSIVSIRPYQGPLKTDTQTEYKGAVFIKVDSHTFCSTDTFRVELKYEGSEAIYSAAMSAMMAGKKIHIEVKPRAEGCEFGHEIQSITVVN